jgi:hypothetical protein
VLFVRECETSRAQQEHQDRQECDDSHTENDPEHGGTSVSFSPDNEYDGGRYRDYQEHDGED